jgi:hypothetical protein
VQRNARGERDLADAFAARAADKQRTVIARRVQVFAVIQVKAPLKGDFQVGVPGEGLR